MTFLKRREKRKAKELSDKKRSPMSVVREIDERLGSGQFWNYLDHEMGDDINIIYEGEISMDELIANRLATLRKEALKNIRSSTLEDIKLVYHQLVKHPQRHLRFYAKNEKWGKIRDHLEKFGVCQFYKGVTNDKGKSQCGSIRLNPQFDKELFVKTYCN